MVAPRKVGRGRWSWSASCSTASTPEMLCRLRAGGRATEIRAGLPLVAGDFDYFLKIRVGDMEDFNRIHGEQLIALPGVRQTRTFFVMKEVVDNAPLDF
jgi:Lrp/AsnC family leucine-responsive transcriptional regulator